MALKLPRLQRLVAIVEAGKPTVVFHQWWQKVAEALETAIGGIQDNVAAINAALGAANIANAAAKTANAAAAAAGTAATNAQAAADATAAETRINNSYVTGVTLTASDAGSNATVAVTAHTRIYGDGTSVSVNAGSITALTYSTLYYVYYVQASRAGGAVTYLATTSQATAAQTGDTHLLGSVTTPVAAAPNNTGRYILPPKLADLF